jgi:hypothetical protein
MKYISVKKDENNRNAEITENLRRDKTELNEKIAGYKDAI